MIAKKEEVLSPAQQQLELAYERNVLAAERNLMAWIRTSLTLVAFGFAIERFFSQVMNMYSSTAVCCFENRAWSVLR